MAAPKKLLKAKLREITWTEGQQVQKLDHEVEVQFNPESLKVNFANQKAGGDQRGGSATQYVGQGTTKLSFDLWFDVTAPEPENQTDTDVRKLTEKVVYFIKPKESGQRDKFIAPGVQFSWGTFLFEGTMESVNETLEYFSEDGRPLRAQLSVTLTQQEIQFKFGQQASPGLGSTPMAGTRPQRPARADETMQSIAGESGRQDQWQADALRNGIENPRRLAPGATLDLAAPRLASASPSLGVTLPPAARPAVSVARPTVSATRPPVASPRLALGS
jgi:hypothetical protein